ncbi:hypothetical protein BD769DRAFT_1676246 [Suillus cothurnatus]|nr:hypothetical protein BD769DRAFT_1676246 [Suillus cothurnatus]
MPNPSQPLNDGIRWQDQECRCTIPVQRGTRELEVAEVKFDFIPNSQDTAAWRMRRRYRLHKDGHPQVVLIHYSRVPPIRNSRAALWYYFSPRYFRSVDVTNCENLVVTLLEKGAV